MCNFAFFASASAADVRKKEEGEEKGRRRGFTSFEMRAGADFLRRTDFVTNASAVAVGALVLFWCSVRVRCT